MSQGSARRLGGERGQAFEIWFDGAPLRAYPGETVAAVLLAAGRRRTRVSGQLGAPRGVYCAMGLCWECVVVVDGRPNLRACVTPVAPGMRIETQHGPGDLGGENP
jgi:predicted molibdopterin-dependent oxidoreductase YjgC